MYVRQEAYYNAVPEGGKLTRAEQIERGKEEVIPTKKNSDDDSEFEGNEADTLPVEVLERQEIPMPDLSPGCEYLVAFLHSAGTVSSSGTGLIGLSWQEIEAWARCNDLLEKPLVRKLGSRHAAQRQRKKRIVTPRDMKTIYTLSRVYASEYAKASKKGAKPPYSPKVANIEEVREVVSQKVEDIFAGLLANQKR